MRRNFLSSIEVRAAAAGFYRSPGRDQDYPCIQIYTVEELLRGAQLQMPPAFGTYRQASRVKQETDNEQGESGI